MTHAEVYANLGSPPGGRAAQSAARSGDPLIGWSGDRKERSWGVKPTPSWDDLGIRLYKSFGILVERWGEGYRFEIGWSVDPLIWWSENQGRTKRRKVPKLPRSRVIGKARAYNWRRTERRDRTIQA